MSKNNRVCAHAQALRSRLHRKKLAQAAPLTGTDRGFPDIEFDDGTRMNGRCFFELAAAAIHRGEFDDDTDDEFLSHFLGTKPPGL